jgi:hypothetical protein
MRLDNIFGETNFNPDMVMTKYGTKSSQKPEMTAEEFIETYLSNRMDKPQILADLRSVIRGELIKYERYAGCEYGTLKDTEEFIDAYMKSNNQ